MDKILGIIGTNYELTTPETRAKLSDYFYNILKNKILGLDPQNEVVIISTCNRVEVYFYGIGIKEIIQEDLNNPDFYYYEDEKACQHLFKVSCGVFSMLLGENEILGQIKLAYKNALDNKESKKYLNRLFQETFSFAKQVRTNTDIGSFRVSYPGIVVNLINSVFDHNSYKVLIIGFGSLGQLIHTYLKDAGFKDLTVANRNPEKVQGFKSIEFSQIQEQLPAYDIIISAIPVVNAFSLSRLAKISKTRLVCDLGDQRNFYDIDDEVFYYDLEKITFRINRNLQVRQDAVFQVEKLAIERSKIYKKWLEKQKNLQNKLVLIGVLEKSLIKAENKDLQRLINKFKHLIYSE